jgi:hypothetical protein
MALNLGPQAQQEASAGEALEVPGDLGRHHRAAGKGDGHIGTQVDPLRVLGGDHEWKEWIVASFGHHKSAEAEGFEAAGVFRYQADARCRVAPASVLPGLNAEDVDFNSHRLP